MEDLVPTILYENKRLEDEISRLKQELIELKKINKEAENKYLKMFIENEKLVDTLDLINGIIKESVK